jgi:hypothetical protein
MPAWVIAMPPLPHIIAPLPPQQIIARAGVAASRFLTSYPVNWWLVSVGIKERM